VHPNRAVTWTHFGGGVLEGQLRSLAAHDRAANLHADIKGNCYNADVLKSYAQADYHLFLNTSVSEGAPVSIMEALAHSIPVLAAGVGGNPELVGEDAGGLLSPDPSPGEIADGIAKIVLARDYSTLSDNAYGRWDELYNAARNHHDFKEFLISQIRAVRQ
jgi:glycosyltransferase involved in cell wall biosynthesis